MLTVTGHDDEADGSEFDLGDKDNEYCDEKTFDDFVMKIISMVADPNPTSRHSTGIWLLALVKNCSKKPSIYKRVDIIQYAFTELLSDDSGKLEFDW